MESYVNGKLVTTPSTPVVTKSSPTSPPITLEEEDAVFLDLFQYRKFLGELDDSNSVSYAQEVLRFVNPSKDLPKDEVLLRLQRLANKIGVIGEAPKKRMERMYAYIKAANSVHSIVMEVSGES